MIIMEMQVSHIFCMSTKGGGYHEECRSLNVRHEKNMIYASHTAQLPHHKRIYDYQL